MKLEKFDKNKKGKIIVASVVLGLFLIIGGVYLFRSHAIFEEHKTFDVIFGKVPPFKKKEKDLELAILVDGESASVVPTDKDYRVRVECDTDEISGSWDYTNWYANISGHVTKPVICTIIFESIYDSITVDGESRNTFPEKGDYQYNMTCSNVTNYSWNEDTWTPTVTGVNKDSSCNLVFKSTNNIITKITFDGEERSSYPSREETGSVEITCTPESVTGEWDKENWKVKRVNNITSEATCEVAFNSKPAIYDVAEVGDYVAYTPSKTSYDIANELTGMNDYNNNSSEPLKIKNDGKQTINPSLQNLWRVIKKNEDETVEIVSEYVSSKDVYFFGINGYKKFVGSLNTIAKSYETEGITKDSRHFGYSNQTEVISGDLCIGTTCTESTGGGDTGYMTDLNLVKESYGDNTECAATHDNKCESLNSKRVNDDGTISENFVTYWIASRTYRIDGNSYPHGRYGKFWWYGYMGDFYHLCYGTTCNGTGMNRYAIRPIVTLKSGLTATESEKDGKKLWTVN